MIAQFAFYATLQITGWLFIRRFMATQYIWLKACLAFLFGLAIFSFFEINAIAALDLTHIPGRFAALPIIVILIVSGSLVAAQSPRPNCTELAALFVMLCLTFIVIIVLAAANPSHATYDSFMYMYVGEILAVDGLWAHSTEYPSLGTLYYPILHALSINLDLDYMWALSGVFNMFFIASFFLLSKISIEKLTKNILLSILLPVFILTLLYSNYHFMRIAFHQNTHIFVGAYTMIFFALLWHGLQDRDQKLIFLSVIFLMSTVVMRHEFIFLVPTFMLLIFQSKVVDLLSFRLISIFAGSYITFYCLSYTQLMLGRASPALSAEHTLVGAAIGVAITSTGVLAGQSRISRAIAMVRPHLLAVILPMISIVTASLVTINFDRAVAGVMVLSGHALFFGNWTVFWWVVLAFTILLSVFSHPRISHIEVISVGILIFFLATVGLFAIGDWMYRFHGTHATNRMLVHIAPTVIFYLMLRYANVIAVRADTTK